MSAEVVVTEETRADDGGPKHLLRPHGMDAPDWGAADDLAVSLANAGVEIDRLQRRVVELEAALSDERTLREIDQRTADKSLEYAAEQRKRAEEAEARLQQFAHGVEAASKVSREERDLHLRIAIEKARQEERERCAAIARRYGPSRPPTDQRKPCYRDRHLGECAASSGIAHLIETLETKP